MYVCVDQTHTLCVCVCLCLHPSTRSHLLIHIRMYFLPCSRDEYGHERVRPLSVIIIII